MVENIGKEPENILPDAQPPAAPEPVIEEDTGSVQDVDAGPALSDSTEEQPPEEEREPFFEQPHETDNAGDLKERIKRRIQHNLLYKISAIILAALLWTYVTASQNPLTEATYTIPIEQRNLSSELALMEQNHQVQIRVQGNSTVIGDLTTKDFAAYIDCTGVLAGEATLQVKVDLPPGVQLVSQSPESIDVTIENVVSEVFSVELKIIGQPAEGFSLMDAMLTPSQITVYGPAERMKQVSAVAVSADVTDAVNSYNQNLSLEVLDASGVNISQWFTIVPNTCNVVIPISASMPEKEVAVSAVVNGQPAAGFQVSQVVVEPSTVRILGDMDTLRSLYYVETQPIDVSGLRESITRTVDLVAENGVTLSTASVTVAIKIDAVSTASVSKHLLHVENLKDTLSAAVPDLTVEITVSGPAALIQDLDPTMVIPYVECSEITEPGTYTLPVRVSLPSNLSAVSCAPDTVSVQISAKSGNEPSTENGAAGDGEAVNGADVKVGSE
ncbi:MAG: hypothetical protein K6B40_01500 [Firmicutes bacterium]|nr:hypothetical protein [Bacillota bacterium]